MKHLLLTNKLGKTFNYEDDGCGLGSCEGNCTLSCTGTTWCLLDAGR